MIFFAITVIFFSISNILFYFFTQSQLERMTYSLYKCYPTILPICCIFHNFQVTMPISPRIILAQRINSTAKMIRDVDAVLNRRKKRYIIPKKTSLCPPCARRAFPCPPCFRGGAQRPFAMDGEKNSSSPCERGTTRCPLGNSISRLRDGFS